MTANGRRTPGPIFVIGFNGSGTTMLAEALGRHPAVYAFPGETRLIPHFLDEAARRGGLDDDDRFLALWQEILRSVPAFRRLGSGVPPLPPAWRTTERTAAAIFDAIFSALAADAGKTRWCEKSPQNLQHLRTLAAAFPDARIVHLVRDGRDCAASLHRRWRRTPELIVARWRESVADARAQGPLFGDRYREVRYEDLTADPRLVLAGLLDFLGLEFSEDVLVSSRPQSEHEGEFGGIEANSGKWRSYFSEATALRLDRIAGPFLDEVGYPRLTHAPVAETPGRLALALWRGADFVRALWLQRQRRRARQPAGRTQGSLLQDLKTSIRSYRSNRF